MQLEGPRRIGRRVQGSRTGKPCAAYYWGTQLQIPRRNGRRVQGSRKGKPCVAYYWGMQLQIARRLIFFHNSFGALPAREQTKLLTKSKKDVHATHSLFSCHHYRGKNTNPNQGPNGNETYVHREARWKIRDKLAPRYTKH